LKTIAFTDNLQTPNHLSDMFQDNDNNRTSVYL